MSGRYCNCPNHIKDSHKSLGGHIGLCKECCYTLDKVAASNKLADAILEVAKQMKSKE